MAERRSKERRVSVLPEIVRGALREELQMVVSYPRQVIEDPGALTEDKLAAWEMLAKYGVGASRHVSGELQHTHGVVQLPPMDERRALPAAEVIDEIEVVE